MKTILVTGAAGQLGSELVPALRTAYGDANVIASDIKTPEPGASDDGPFITLDCMDAAAVGTAAREHHIDTVFHLAALLSAAAERAPQRAYDINMRTLMNVLEVAREQHCAVFTPSSIGAFGPTTPREPAPQDTVQRPTTMYGITKVAGEMLCDYYALRFGVDTRGVRYPGLISYVTPPGGGTTDYAVEIFYHALEHGNYTCFLAEDTQLDMMYMPDAVRAAIELMEADSTRLEHRNAFNVTAMQLTPALLAKLIQKHVPDFRISYKVDPMRQAIADSWPCRLDDSAARTEWDWEPHYDADAMTADMIEQLSARIGGKS